MKDTMIGVDLAERVFQVHGASMTGHVKFRKKLSREQFRKFMAEQRDCGAEARDAVRFTQERKSAG